MSREFALQLLYHTWVPWTAIALVVLLSSLGLLALLSQQCFATVVTVAAKWTDSNSWLKKGDRMVDIDKFVLRRSRLFGAIVLAWVGLMAFTLPRPLPLPLPLPLPWAVCGGMATVAILGAIALLVPQFFVRLTRLGSTWIDTTAIGDFFDRPYYIDDYAIQHRRVFGVVLLLGASSIGYLAFC